MVNSNLLKGYKCPQCGHESPLLIDVRACLRLSDDGYTDDDIEEGSIHWDYDSWTTCPECGYAEDLSAFEIPTDPEPKVIEGPCPHCGREENGTWLKPCPNDNCPSNNPKEAIC